MNPITSRCLLRIEIAGTDGKYYFGGVVAGTYCVSVVGNPTGGYKPSVLPASATITLGPDASGGKNLGFWIELY